MKDVVVIGSSNQDIVIKLPRIPNVGETLLGGKSSMIFGGKGANQAVTAARLGGDIAFITKLGRDIFGTNMLIHFENEKLPKEFILIDEHEPTGIAQIFVSEKGENSIAVAPGSNGTLSIPDLQPFEELIANAKFILMQLEIPIKTVEFVAQFASKSNAKIIINPAPARPLSDDLLSNTWLLTPNEYEASILTGIQVVDISSAQEAGAILLSKGVQHVIITLGENGSIFCNLKGSTHFKSFKVNAVDTTAAGDVFNGALAVALTRGESIIEAIPFASAAAAISVSKMGAQTSIPHLDEVNEFLVDRFI